ncbi:MAG: 1-acyl-sn-glycerol-3-phosphate acyltransferase [Clostridia bacterium]|nr:1-acyl-sn-glycerol-3-phosphate acyltransferase [Clostridia bacterium]
MQKKEGRSSKGRKKPWIRRQYRILLRIFGPLIGLIMRWKYRVTAEKFPAQKKRQFLILYNHQTPMDQFFIMMSCPEPVYHLASEDIFSKGWISAMLRWAVAPIPIKKMTMDLNAVRSMIRVAREGGTLAMAPEGNRTYSGKTEYMNPAVAHLAKRLRLPIALYRIEGGYGVQPRWSDGIRKGRMHAGVSRVIEPEEFENMSDEELYEVIREGLYVNEAAPGGRYVSKRKAEYLERMAYVCPFCGFSKWESRGDITRCVTCGREVRYGEDKRMEGIGFEFPFPYVNDWYEFQQRYVNSQDLLADPDRILFRDTADLYEVIAYKRKNRIAEKQTVLLYGNRIEIGCGEGRQSFSFADITGTAVLGRNKLNIYAGEKIMQLKGDPHFNALKYMNLYYRYRNQTQGDQNGEFLGL